MPYWRLHYHGIWACKNREPLITAELEPELYQYLRGKSKELGAIVHAVGGIEDHIHIVFSLPLKYALDDFIGKLKGASSHWVKHVLHYPGEFDWQRGYGVLSYAGRNLKNVISCVCGQKEHHRNQTVNEMLERWDEEEDGVEMIRDETEFCLQ